MAAVDDRDVAAAATALLGRPVGLVRPLGGGQHARTVLVAAGREEYVVRLFPPGDRAVEREVEVLSRLSAMAELVPRLVAHGEAGRTGSIIVTSRVRGAHPASTLAAGVIAEQMAGALARIHRHSGRGLRDMAGGSADRVLTHYDFWCGNALWEDDVLTGVVDWSGARRAPRGVDLAWCRLDLVLLGSVEAADVFLRRYESRAQTTVADIGTWDAQAAAQAHDAVESWAPNYHAIGRPELTAGVLRRRFDAWSRHLTMGR